MIIAIDGPSGSGKSTTAKILAEKLNFNYLDTGSMFRAITYKILNLNVEINNEEALKKVLMETRINFDNGSVILDNKNVSLEIRTEEININLGKVAVNKLVRDHLLTLQREIGLTGNWILDGRDIGTVVFPDAEFKFYLDATPEERATRRYNQNIKLKISSNYEEILQNIINRDQIDMTREIAPLKKAEDAFLIDSDKMSVDEVINFMSQKIEGEKWVMLYH